MLYRRPGGTDWEPLDLETATDMIADRIVATRSRTWQDTDEQGRAGAVAGAHDDLVMAMAVGQAVRAEELARSGRGA